MLAEVGLWRLELGDLEFEELSIDKVEWYGRVPLEAPVTMASFPSRARGAVAPERLVERVRPYSGLDMMVTFCLNGG